MNQFNEFAEKRAYLVKYKMVTHIATNIFWQLCPLRGVLLRWDDEAISRKREIATLRSR
jgi:hypothetical protein